MSVRYQPFSREVDLLLDELEANFRPRCIEPNEDLHTHLRYAGKVELAQYILARLRPTQEDFHGE